MHYLVVIHYANNQVDPLKQQLLWLEPLGGDTDLKDFDNTELDLKVDRFVAHNFSLDPNWQLYYYITGINDAAHPFDYGSVRACLQSPFTSGQHAPRFGDRSGLKDQSSTANAGSVIDSSLASSVVSDALSDVNLAPVKRSVARSSIDYDHDEPSDVLDQLMRKSQDHESAAHKKQSKRGDQHDEN